MPVNRYRRSLETQYGVPSSFRLTADIDTALRLIKDREGIPMTEQVRRALRSWIRARNARWETWRTTTLPSSKEGISCR